MFKGLFIGIDRYASSQISWLNCAEKDAKALYSLFTDNIEGESKLLLGENATKDNIEESIKDLINAQNDDTVFIAFSGHGTTSHEIVAYDTEIDKLEETSISLEELTKLFSQIPAKQVIFLLDCCFSGEMGAKVLQVDALSREVKSTETYINELSGEGRLIITASSPSQPAWETQTTGHGLLTDYFIKALLGADEVVKNNRISLYSLVDYLTNKVVSAAKLLGKEQTPAVRCKIDQNFNWPIFSIGQMYESYFPEYKKISVTSDLNDLVSFGFDKDLVNSLSSHIPSLNQLQIDAINNYNLLSGEHLIVSAPTSSGKTMIGELASLMAIKNKKRALFLLPMKALVNDKHSYFNAVYGEYGINIIQATGDTHDDVPLLIRGQYDVCLMTYEKFTSLVLGFPHILEQLGVIVIDEAQMIADTNRGANLEFILTVINSKRKYGINPQLIALSAVIGDTNGLEMWLDANLLRREDRPVPLLEGVVNGRGAYRYINSEDNSELIENGYVTRLFGKGSSQEIIKPLVQKLVTEGKQVIVFREMKGEARGAARYLANHLHLPSADGVITKLPKGDQSIISNALLKSLEGGVAFHTSDLDKDERKIIEESFRAKDSKIRVLTATTTLAMGVNTPADAVIIAGLIHPGKIPTPYSVAEYKNMVGRAGRLGYSDIGYSYLITLDSRMENDYWQDYVLNKPEDITSKFFYENTDLRTLIVKVLVTTRNASSNRLNSIYANTIIDFLETSFGAFQISLQNPNWSFDKSEALLALQDLESHGLVFKDSNGSYKLTKLGWLAGQGIIEVESIIRLVDIINSLRPEEINDPTLLALASVTVELSQKNNYFPVNSRGAKKELSSWSQELLRQDIPSSVVQYIKRISPDDYSAAAQVKKVSACLLWITSMKMSEIEDIIMRHGRKFDGAAGAIRSSSSRTKDMIMVVSNIVELLHSSCNLSERSKDLFNRLEVGTPSDIIEIVSNLGNKLSRSDYHSLMDRGVNTFSDVAVATDDIILSCISGNVEKLNMIRDAFEEYENIEIKENDFIPLLPEYEAY